MTTIIVIYIIFTIVVAAYVVINSYNLIRFRLDRLENDRSKVMLFTYLAIVITVFLVSIISAIISYNL